MAESDLPRQVCLVLGRDVLWKVFAAAYSEEEEPHGMPASLSSRELAAYGDIGERCTLPPTENPIARLPLGLTGVDSQLIVNLIMTDADNNGGGGGTDFRTRAGMEREEVRLLSSQVLQLRRELADSRDEATRRDFSTKNTLSRLNRNVARLAVLPLRRSVDIDASQEEESTGQEARLAAILIPRPRTLHDLWKEYQFGGPGRKPAKDFTASERGKVKVAFSRRKVLWDKVSELVRNGVAAQVACDLVYEAYGQNMPVTKIMAKMKIDKCAGDWPARLSVRIE
jgi:hypothetical protein